MSVSTGLVTSGTQWTGDFQSRYALNFSAVYHRKVMTNKISTVNLLTKLTKSVVSTTSDVCKLTFLLMQK